MTFLKHITAALVATLVLVAPVRAATLDIVVSQAGSDVILQGHGEIDLSGLSYLATLNLSSFGNANLTNSVSISGSLVNADVYDLLDFKGGLSSTEDFNFSAIGDMFGISAANRVALPVGYQSLDPISFTWTVANTTIGALDLNFGTIASSSNNTVTLSPVPLPAGVLLLMSGLGGLFMMRRRARYAAAT